MLLFCYNSSTTTFTVFVLFLHFYIKLEFSLKLGDGAPGITGKAIPINCLVSHRPTDPLFFKVPFKENITDPYFWKFQWKKKVFNLKELYYFEIIFWLFFFYPIDRPNLSRWRAMGNKTFYWDGLNNFKKIFSLLFRLTNNLPWIQFCYVQ